MLMLYLMILLCLPGSILTYALLFAITYASEQFGIPTASGRWEQIMIWGLFYAVGAFQWLWVVPVLKRKLWQEKRRNR